MAHADCSCNKFSCVTLLLASRTVSRLLSVSLHFSVTLATSVHSINIMHGDLNGVRGNYFFCTIINLMSCIFSVERVDQQRTPRLPNRFRLIAYSSWVRRNFVLELDRWWCIEVESTWTSARAKWPRRRLDWDEQEERSRVDIWVRCLFFWVCYAPGKSQYLLEGRTRLMEILHRPSRAKSHSAKQKSTSVSLLINTTVLSLGVRPEWKTFIGILFWSVVLVIHVRDRL